MLALRRLVLCILLAAASASLSVTAKGQGFDTTPPVVTITPDGGEFATTSLAVEIEWCDETLLNHDSREILLNGSGQAGFTYTTLSSTGQCNDRRHSEKTITLQAGANTLSATICDMFGNCTTAVAPLRYTVVAVTPDGLDVSAPQRTAGVTRKFSVQNIGTTSGTFTLQAVCTGSVTNCSTQASISLNAGASDSVSVTYQTDNAGTSGNVYLKAWLSSNSTARDSGKVTVTAQSSLLVWTSIDNDDHQMVPLCVHACFGVAYSHATPPYVSLGAPRSVTLSYHGDRVAVRPFVYADVTLMAGADSVNELWLQVKDSSGAFLPFVNGDATKIRFKGGPVLSEKRRLGGQIDASSWPTGIHSITLVVTATRGTYNETWSSSTSLLVLNELKSPIARGWTLAGIQRARIQANGFVLVAEGDGSAVRFHCPLGSICVSPPSEVSLLTYTGSGASRIYQRAYRDGKKAWFRSTGLLDSIADQFGNTTRYEYDASDRLIKIYDPIRTYNGGANRSYIALTYGTYGLTQVQEPGADGSPTGGRITYTYVNADSTLRKIVDPDGDSTRFGYDGSRRLASATDRRGSVQEFVYDPTSWKLVRIDGPQIAVDAGGGSTQNVTLSTTFAPSQAVGVPSASTASAPANWARVDTIRARVTDAEGQTTSFVLDRWGQPLVVTDPLGNTTTIQRSGIFAERVTHPSGAVDRYSYGGTTQVQWQQLSGSDTTYFEYDSYEQVSHSYGPRQASQRIYRSGVGRVDSIKIGNLYKTTFRYDSRGRDTLVTDPAGHTTRTHYDAVFGNRDSTVMSGRRFIHLKFDRYGRDSVITSNGGVRRTLVYDLLNRLVRDSSSADSRPTLHTYDALFLTQVRDSKGQLYKWEVNALGWKVKEYDPADTVTWSRYVTRRYDRLGRLTSSTNRRGQRVDRTYDALGRIVSKSGPAPELTDYFSYSTTGRIQVAWNDVSRDSIFQDSLGRADSVITRIAGTRFRRHFKYAGRQLDSVLFHTSGSIVFANRHYARNATTRGLDSVMIGGTRALRIARNADGRDSTHEWPSSVVRTTLYTSTHKPYNDGFNTTAIDTAFWRGYGYSDSLPRVTEVSRKQGSDVKVRSYRYNAFGALARSAYGTIVNNTCPAPTSTTLDDGERCSASQSLVADSIFGISYDAAGNATQQHDSTHSTSITGAYTAGNRMSAWGSTTYSSDLDGNIATRTRSGATVTLVWTSDNRLGSVIAGTDTLKYDYNAFGQLVRKRRNNVTERHFIWDGGDLWLELDGTAANRVAEYVYLPGLRGPLAIVTGGQAISTTRYLHVDRLRTVIGAMSGASISHRAEYDPWGNKISDMGTLADTNRLRWKGLFWEGDSARLYNVMQRWYDPESGRFLSEDPISLAGGINKYVFAGNDPVNGTDRNGLENCVAIQATVVNADYSVGTKTVEVCGGGGKGLVINLAPKGKHHGPYVYDPTKWRGPTGLDFAGPVGGVEKPRPCPAQLADASFWISGVYFRHINFIRRGENRGGGNIANYVTVSDPISADGNWIWEDGEATLSCHQFVIDLGGFGLRLHYELLQDYSGVVLPYTPPWDKDG